MIIPIRCFSCGKPVAHLYKKFKEMSDSEKSSKEILDELGLKRYCCRAQMMGQADTLELINKFKKF